MCIKYSFFNAKDAACVSLNSTFGTLPHATAPFSVVIYTSTPPYGLIRGIAMVDLFTCLCTVLKLLIVVYL